MAAVAGCISYAAVSWLLGFHWFGSELHPFEHVRAFRAEVREVLAFERGGHLAPETIDDFAAALGVQTSGLTSLERSHPDHIPLEAVIRLNPYPQVLRTQNYPYWLSLGYRSTDSRYHQVTWYGGESDTTPSLLVKKVTPRATGWGDYFVRYTVILSKETTAQPEGLSSTGVVTRWRHPSDRPQIETLRWHAYRGGSYDGLEEVGFTFLGTLLFTPPLALFALALVRRRGLNGRVDR